MDTVIDKLSEIEAAAQAITDEANARKKAFAQEMDQKTKAFDAELEQETSARIRKVQESMEADMNRKQAQQKADSDALIRQIAENYEKKHETYAEALFKAMIKERGYGKPDCLQWDHHESKGDGTMAYKRQPV